MLRKVTCIVVGAGKKILQNLVLIAYDHRHNTLNILVLDILGILATQHYSFTFSDYIFSMSILIFRPTLTLWLGRWSVYLKTICTLARVRECWRQRRGSRSSLTYTTQRNCTRKVSCWSWCACVHFWHCLFQCYRCIWMYMLLTFFKVQYISADHVTSSQWDRSKVVSWWHIKSLN